MTEQHKQTAIVRARQIWKARQETLMNLTSATIAAIPAFVCVIQAHDSELNRLCMIEGVVDALLDDMTKELLTLSGASTTSPADSPDSQAIEQARAAVIELTAYEALGLAKLPGLEDLRRILGG